MLVGFCARYFIELENRRKEINDIFKNFNIQFACHRTDSVIPPRIPRRQPKYNLRARQEPSTDRTIYAAPFVPQKRNLQRDASGFLPLDATVDVPEAVDVFVDNLSAAGNCNDFTDGRRVMAVRDGYKIKGFQPSIPRSTFQSKDGIRLIKKIFAGEDTSRLIVSVLLLCFFWPF